MIRMTADEMESPVYLQGRKASEVFLEYAAPVISLILEEMGRPLSIEEYDKLLKLPWYLWNKIISETDTKDNLVSLLKQMDNIYHNNMPFGAEQLIRFMEERKRTDFKQYKYYLGKYEVYKKSNGEVTIRIQHIPAPFE